MATIKKTSTQTRGQPKKKAKKKPVIKLERKAEIISALSLSGGIFIQEYICFDPSNSSLGVSRWSRQNSTDYQLKQFFSLSKGWSAKDVYTFLQTHPVRCIFIEEQFIGSNPHTAINIIEARMRIQIVAELMNLNFKLIPIQTWQKSMLAIDGEKFPTKKGDKTTHIMPREVTKERSVKVANEIIKKIPWIGSIENDDEADAICIGQFISDLTKFK